MFITVEGIDGCGKTTLATSIVKYFQMNGLRSVYTRQPGSIESSFGKSIRNILLTENMNPVSETLLFLADRCESLNNVIIPKLNDNFIVVCDRFNDSTIAYQGFGRKLDIVESLIQISGCHFDPDLTFFINVSLDISCQRRSNLDRIENDSDIDFMNRVTEGFKKLAHQNGKRTVEIDGSLNKEDVLENALKIIEKRFSLESFRK